MPHHLKTKPRRQADPRPVRGTGDFSYEVHARLDVPCRCGGGRLDVRTDRRARPVATVTHDTGCPLGALVADQPSVVVATQGGGHVVGGKPAPTPGPTARPGADYTPADSPLGAVA